MFLLPNRKILQFQLPMVCQSSFYQLRIFIIWTLRWFLRLLESVFYYLWFILPWLLAAAASSSSLSLRGLVCFLLDIILSASVVSLIITGVTDVSCSQQLILLCLSQPLSSPHNTVHQRSCYSDSAWNMWDVEEQPILILTWDHQLHTACSANQH